MNVKTTIILFGALVGMLLVLVFLMLFFGVKKPGEFDQWVLPEFHDKQTGTTGKDVDTVEIVRTKPTAETLIFVKNYDVWQMVKPYPLRVDNLLVERLVNQVTEAKKEKVEVSTNLGESGLDEPSIVVTLKKGVEREWQLNVGQETGGTTTQVVYVTSSARKQPMAVGRNSLDAVFRRLNDFRSKELLSRSVFNAEAVAMTVSEGDSLSLVKGKDAKWRFEKPAFGEADAESDPKGGDERKITGVQELLQNLGHVRTETESDFVEVSASEEDLAKKYGLAADKPERMRIEVRSPLGRQGKPATETLLIGKKVEDKEAKMDYHYARLAGENAVVRVPAHSFAALEAVTRDPDALRNRYLVELDLDRTDAIDIKNATGEFKLRKTWLGRWHVFAGGSGRDADTRAIGELLLDLTGERVQVNPHTGQKQTVRERKVKSFPSDKREPELGFGKTEVAIWVDGLKGDEKEEKKEDKKASGEPALKSDKPTVRLVFGKQEDGVLYIKRQVGDEKPMLLAIDAAPLANKLNDGPLTYLNRTLPPMPQKDAVARIQIVRPGEVYELEKTSPKTWSVQQPAPFKGRTADLSRIDNLFVSYSNLDADRYVAEKKPSDKDEDWNKVLESTYGLKSPAYKIAFTTKDKEKPEEHAFLFGKELDDKSGRRYAKLGNSDLIFLVQAKTVENLQGSLLDPTVFRFDPAKVRVVKLTGWHLIDTSIAPLEMVRQDDGQWKARLDVDPGKVESFLSRLADLRAQEFLVGAPKPEHKVALGEGGLEIAITFEGDKAPSYTMLVGPHNTANKGYYATNNKLANTVLLLPEDEAIKGAMAAPKYFQKAKRSD